MLVVTLHMNMRNDALGPKLGIVRESDGQAALESLDITRLVTMLKQLTRSAPTNSEDFLFAHHYLAELTAESDPWKAAISAKKLIDFDPYDDSGWALYAHALSNLAHYRAAAKAYRRAVSLAPNNPWYAHNLGHLLDAVLGRPEEGLPFLESAHRMKPQEIDIALSYARALGNVGRFDEARAILHSSATDSWADREQQALLAWFDLAGPGESPDYRVQRREQKRRPADAPPR